MSDLAYKCGSRDYLARAQMRLGDNSPEAMFYAAFELRCGIEARLQEYLEVQEHIAQKRRKGWKSAELGKNLKRAFDDGDKIIQILISDDKSGKRVACYYTPVRASLKKKGQQLGHFLHAMKKFKPRGDASWKIFRELLVSSCQELKLATTGTLLGPPLLSPDNKSKLDYELGYDENNDDFMKEFGRAGNEIKMPVRYLDDLPVKIDSAIRCS